MNKFQRTFILCCLFSYAFSLKVTKIEPTTVTYGENVDFTLIVQDYEPSKDYSFYLTNYGDDTKLIYLALLQVSLLLH